MDSPSALLHSEIMAIIADQADRHFMGSRITSNSLRGISDSIGQTLRKYDIQNQLFDPRR